MIPLRCRQTSGPTIHISIGQDAVYLGQGSRWLDVYTTDFHHVWHQWSGSIQWKVSVHEHHGRVVHYIVYVRHVRSEVLLQQLVGRPLAVIYPRQFEVNVIQGVDHTHLEVHLSHRSSHDRWYIGWVVRATHTVVTPW
jgi:hypothetical protein